MPNSRGTAKYFDLSSLTEGRLVFLALVLALLLTGLALSKEKDSIRRVIELKNHCSKRHSSLASYRFERSEILGISKELC